MREVGSEGMREGGGRRGGGGQFMTTKSLKVLENSSYAVSLTPVHQKIQLPLPQCSNRRESNTNK